MTENSNKPIKMAKNYWFSRSMSSRIQEYVSFFGKLSTTGLLIGMGDIENTVRIFNVVNIGSDDVPSDWVTRTQAVEEMLPAPLSVLGVVHFAQETPETYLDACVEHYQKFSLVMACKFSDFITSSEFEDMSLFERHGNNFHKIEDRRAMWKLPSDMVANLVTIRLNAPFSIVLNWSCFSYSGEVEAELRKRFQNTVSNNNNSFYASFAEKNIFLQLGHADNDIEVVHDSTTNLNEQSTVGDLMRVAGAKGDAIKRKLTSMTNDVVDCQLLTKLTTVDKSACVPIVHYETGEFASCNVPANLLMLVVCHESWQLTKLSRTILESFRRQSILFLSSLIKYSDLNTAIFSRLHSYIFYPRDCCHFITTYFPSELDNDALENHRRNLHLTLRIPTNRPMFRKTAAFSFPSEAGPYLINVHESVPDNKMLATSVALVDGRYQYRHYMQDGFDDNMWGCAYRSFQTVCSWYLLQGYTDTPVPSHREIQQALVDVNDKPANFVGSRKWIGSLELSYCLSHLLSVDSRIISVSAGDDMSSKAPELIHHFRSHGTPVMIGGGELAHTILGVAYNVETGEAKFLVLDPHYTGEENLKVIIDKGWCGWKPSSFWANTEFCNMLLPIRPSIY